MIMVRTKISSLVLVRHSENVVCSGANLRYMLGLSMFVYEN